jgi:hypothetical protein
MYTSIHIITSHYFFLRRFFAGDFVHHKNPAFNWTSSPVEYISCCFFAKGGKPENLEENKSPHINMYHVNRPEYNDTHLVFFLSVRVSLYLLFCSHVLSLHCYPHRPQALLFLLVLSINISEYNHLNVIQMGQLILITLSMHSRL